MLQLTIIEHPPTIALLTANTSPLFLMNSLAAIIISTLAILLFLFVFLLLKKQTVIKHTMKKIEQLNMDINERTKNLEQALQKAEESNRLKSLFLANMSHEIRTPLNSILGFSELLAERELDYQDKKLFANQVISNGRNLLKLIDQIFHLAIFETGKVSIKKEEFSINKMLCSLKEKSLNKIVNAKKEIILTINIEDENFEVYTDKLKLKLIINNLIDNAIKFTNRGIIDITCLKTGNDYLFQVTDSGCGLKEDEYEIIFDPFVQGSETLNKIKGGSGLGLSNVKNYVILLGGKIWCTRNRPNGSIFYFTIPSRQKNEKEQRREINISFFNN